MFQTLSKDISAKLENNIDQQKKFVQIKENCLKEIDEANENAKSKRKNLEEKMAYFLDKAKRLVSWILILNIYVEFFKKYFLLCIKVLFVCVWCLSYYVQYKN